jgi:hypothetical protein
MIAVKEFHLPGDRQPSPDGQSQLSGSGSDLALAKQASWRASQCLFEISWDQIRFQRQKVPTIRYRQPHRRVINSKIKPSPIYAHGAQLTTTGEDKFWLCKYCHLKGAHDGALFNSESTGGVMYHLKTVHKLEEFGASKPASDPFSAAKGTTGRMTPYAGARRLPLNDFQFRKDYVDWVIDLDLSFRQATHPRTRKLFADFVEDISKLLPRSPACLSDWVRKAWFDEVDGRRVWLKDQLRLANSKIHLSTDVWTSDEGTNYVAIVAHFLDGGRKLRTALLDLPPLKGPHSGENVASVIARTIDSYSMSAVLGYFVMDNASSNDTCIQQLAKRFSTVRSSSRLRCSGHILNIIVKALLFGDGVSKLEQQLCGASDEERFQIWRKHSFIGKLHNFCVWINRSDQRRELLQTYIAQAYAKGNIQHLYTRVLVDGGIRWNSVYKMIDRALQLRDAIDLLFLNWEPAPAAASTYDLRQDRLSKQDWLDLQHFHDVLKPFKDLTKRMEGRAAQAGFEGSHGALWETLESLDVLFKKLQDAGSYCDTHPTEVSLYYSSAIDAARLKLEEYYGLTDSTPAYRCAVALHPANKFHYFELEWRHAPAWIREAKRVVRDTFAQYESMAEAADARELTEEEEAVSDDDEGLDPLEEARRRRRRLAATTGQGRKRQKLTSELDEFMARTNRADSRVQEPPPVVDRTRIRLPIAGEDGF